MSELETKPGGESNDSRNSEANPKVVVGVLATIGLVAIVLGFLHILNTIRSPFSRTTGLSNVTSVVNEEDERLKRQDTDGDGLNDYDELTLYTTSPFLADSDSDAVDDRTEVQRGSDPNCPEGTDCGLAFGDATDGVGNTNAGRDGFLTGDITTKQLRETLIEAGAPAYVVNNTDDETLLRLYQEAVRSPGGNANVTIDDRDLIESLQKLSPSEVREFLVSGGVDPAVLAEIDDTEITDFFRRAVAQELAPQP